MLLVLVLLAAILWVAFSRPAGESPPAETAGAGATPTTAVPSPGATPPPGLLPDEVWLGDIEFESGAVVAAGTLLRDVRASGINVVSGTEGILAARLVVDATVPFDVVGDELGPDTIVGPGEGGEARVVRTVEALGRELDVVATGTVEVMAGRLVVEPTSIDVGGPAFLADLLASIVREFVTIEHEIEGLPEGLVLTSVRVQDDGFRAHLEGADVVVAN
ncbi:MAG: hypothetical protein EOL89_08040 [Actinobacteria bacterium]|nr:hypothetical protein [Actinomycetota bacterium]